MAAMPILQDGFASMSESEDDADDDEGVCSLSEFAMVLNVAAWVSGLCARSRASASIGIIQRVINHVNECVY